MQYTKKILDGIEVVNAALQELDKPVIFKNHDIVLNGMNSEDYLTLHFCKENEKSLNFIVNISSDNVEIHLSGIPEAFFWPYERITKDKVEIKNIIVILLTSTIKVDCYGSNHYTNYKKMYFNNTKGDCIHIVERITGLLPMFILKKLNCETIIYEPFYNQKVE
jgi:hypothetical protein